MLDQIKMDVRKAIDVGNGKKPTDYIIPMWAAVALEAEGHGLPFYVLGVRVVREDD